MRKTARAGDAPTEKEMSSSTEVDKTKRLHNQEFRFITYDGGVAQN